MSIINKLTGLLLIVCTLPATADIHRCTGADGTLLFSDSPCGDETSTFGKYRPAESNGAAGNIKRERLLKAFEVERRQAQQQADEAAALQAERTMKCRHARDQLRVIDRAGRIYNTDDNGNRVIQSDEERAATKRQAMDYIAHWCD
jgi:hypothetical protein